MCDISVRSSHKSLKHRNHKTVKVQGLQHSDSPQRGVSNSVIAYSSIIKVTEILIKTFLWTDASSFDNNMMIRWVRRETKFQVQFGVDVCRDITDNVLLEPYLYNGKLNGDKYFEFLNTTFENYSEHLTLSNRKTLS